MRKESTFDMATPLMNQYLEIKQRFSDALLFFRMGDFYELFFDDARVASSILEIALTTRNKNDPDPIPMCGVPHHAATSYINKLVSCGHKVAICEQLEDPATAKGIVKRDVVRVVTPGTQLDPEALDSSRHNLTHALKIKKDLVQWASCDYSTGRFWFGQCSWEAWVTYIKTSAVTEIVLPEDDQGHLTSNHITKEGISIYKQTVNSFYFDKDYAKQRILEQFETTTLSSIHPHLEESPDILSPIGALIKHFQETTGSRRIPLAHKLDRWDSGTVVELDYTTIQALELNSSQKNQGLFGLLNQTRTAMGARLLRSWMLRPLQDPRLIDERLDQVESFFSGRCLPAANSLQHIYDLERLLVRISTQGANAREIGRASCRERV